MSRQTTRTPPSEPASAARRTAYPTRGALPNVLVIGAMKAGTSAVHRYLDAHPDASMSTPKELNFFFDARTPHAELEPPATHPELLDGWSLEGNWFRGLDWYRRHFRRDTAVRGESSPGYTSPDHPQAAPRIAALLPDVTLVYLVRDPIERALSQYRHHRREGEEDRPPEQALLDPQSQYVARGRYVELLRPYLERFPLDRIVVVAQEELRSERRAALRRLYAAVGLDEGFWSPELEREWHTSDGASPSLPARTEDALREALADDAAALRELLGHDLPWRV